MKLSFSKYHGSGNDFVIIDNRPNKFKYRGFLKQAIIAGICHRQYGIGADGMILLQSERKADFRMEYYNSDGKEGSLCGNGSRCVVAFAHQSGIIKEKQATFMAVDGLHKAAITDISQNKYEVSVQLNDATAPKIIKPGEYFIDTGSPHLVIFNEHLWKIDVNQAGREIRNSSPWAVDGVNVNFAKIIDSQTVAVRTYERGVERETLSCGTGAVAAAISSWYYNKKKQAITGYRINTNGGKLEATFNPPANDKEGFKNLWLHGQAQFVFEGVIKI
jgi:diaminopimelate epimerase